MSRTIVHLDADAFFASVEQAADPRLRGKAVAVGGEKRGIIASASYEARKFGVFTPMPTARARKLCPKLIVLPGDFDKYEHFSRWMFSYAQDFTPDVEIGSIDEGYFDLSAVPKPPLAVADTIRTAIRQSLKITVSEGIASNKLVSQIASKLQKPAAFREVPFSGEISFLHPLPNQWLPGVGPKTAERLNAAGLAKIHHIAHTPLDLLGLLLGSAAPTMRDFANGIDPRPVVPAREPQKSFGHQETFAQDQTDEEYLEAVLRRMADSLFAKVREDGKSVRTLTVKVRYNDMAEDQCSESLREPTDLETGIYGRLHTMFKQAWKRRVSLRLVSLKLSNVYDGRFRSELALDESAQRQEARERLARVVDELRQARGHGVLLRGHDFRLREGAVEAGYVDPAARRECVESGAEPGSARQRLGVRQPSAALEPAPEERQGATALQDASREAECQTQPELRSRREESLSSEKRLLDRAKERFRGFGRPQGIAFSLDHTTTRRDVPWQARSLPSEGSQSLLTSAATAQGNARKHSAESQAGTHIQLRVRSHYSFLDSTLSPKDIVRLAARHDCPAVALTDTGNLHGAVEFVQAAQKAGIRPILGGELNFTNQPLLLYVENARGYANLSRLLSQAEGACGKHTAFSLTPALSPGERENHLPSGGKAGAAAGSSSLSSRVARCGDSRDDRELFEERSRLFPLPGGEGQGEGKRNALSVANFHRRAFCHESLAGFTDGLIAVSSDTSLAELFPGRFYQLATRHVTDGRFPVVACPPVHYATPDHRLQYDIVQSIRTLTLLRQAHPEKRLSGRLHFRTPTEMQAGCRDHPDWLDHTREIAERCRFELPFGKPQFPAYHTPEGSTSSAFLRRLVFEGLHRRYHGRRIVSDTGATVPMSQVQAQVETELAIIAEVGYEDLFLITWDLLQACRERGIEWLTRGSAADSLVCYCLGISDVCPIRFGLYFRRFLNKERMAMHKLPDIDVDFPHDRKDDVVNLLFAKYGPEHCAVVGGFSTFQARSAVADVAKVLGVSDFQIRRFTEHFPWSFGGGWIPIDEVRPRGAELIEKLKASPECRDLPLDEEPFKTAVETAAFLDGFPRHPKMHPCGVVLSRQPMHELTPTFTSNKGWPTTHFDMDAVEAIGLVKMDILAQGGLAAMRDVKQMLAGRGVGVDLERFTAVESAKSENGAPVEAEAEGQILLCPPAPTGLDGSAGSPRQSEAASGFGLRSSAPTAGTLPLTNISQASFDDPAVWEMIARGGARAVHHIESPAMLSLCKQCNVREIDGLIAIVSVIRPGAANEQKKLKFTRRYQGMEPPEYPHPSLEACLRNTFGLVVYEEHILQICETFAGLSAGRADVLRRALVKQKRDIVQQFAAEFVTAARARGRSEEKIREVWELVTGFNGYAFCKAHSTAYGVEAYQAAWLKRYFPAEFMAAVLTNGKGFYHPLVYVLECHRLGIPLLPPSVNEPGPEFKVVAGDDAQGRARNPKSENGAPVEAGVEMGVPIHSTPSEPAEEVVELAHPAALSSAFGFRSSDFLRASFIRVPLTRMKGLTSRTTARLLDERQRGPFVSLADFCRRVAPAPEEAEAMIRVGAFDEFGQSSTAQFWELQHLRRVFGQSTDGQGWLFTKSEVRSPKSEESGTTGDVRDDPPASALRLPYLQEPTRRQRLQWEAEYFDFPVSGHPLELHDDVAWETYCPVARLGEHVGEEVVTCGLIIEQRTHHQITGEPMKFLTLADWTGMVETELFAATYKTYGLATVRYPVLEVAARVEPYENGRGFSLRALRAGKPREKSSPARPGGSEAG